MSPAGGDSIARRAGDVPSVDVAPGLPRLLAGIPARGALSLQGHLALHGPLPDVSGHRGTGAWIVEEVEAAGLRGRGGAAFPTATKLRAVAGTARRALGRPLVVVNAAEGEPASAKDRTLLRSLPHLVLDGAALAAAAVGAREVILGVCETAPGALDALALAIAERGTTGGTARHAWGHESSQDGSPQDGRLFTALAVPGRYVAGHESALVNHLSGGPALPTFTPPRPYERGVRGRPTLVCNVETLAHLALLARHGAAWFRELGTPEQSGSALVTLSGPLPRPGVYEIEHGSPLRALLDAAGGLSEQPRAVLLGGYSGTWIDSSWLHQVALSDRQLAPYEASLGAGVVAVLSADACPIAELARLTRWLASENARQCGPCSFGLDAIAAIFEQLALGGSVDRRSVRHVRGRDRAALGGGRRVGLGSRVGASGRVHGVRREQASPVQRLRELAGLVNGRGACSHPDGVSRMVASALEVFAEELSDHASHGPCEACARPSELPGLSRVSADERQPMNASR